MGSAPAPVLDGLTIDRAVRAVRSISDEELDELLDSWHSLIGLDLMMGRWMLDPEEREAFDRASDHLRAACDARLRAASELGPIVDATAPEKLADIALGHLIVWAWGDRLTQDQRRRLATAWRIVAPKRAVA